MRALMTWGAALPGHPGPGIPEWVGRSKRACGYQEMPSCAIVQMVQVDRLSSPPKRKTVTPRHLLLAVTLGTLVLGFCACGTPNGQVSGVLQMGGGPAPGFLRPVPGSITLIGQSVSYIATAADGTFSLAVASGEYLVVGHCPHGIRDAPGQHVTIRAGVRTHLSLRCASAIG